VNQLLQTFCALDICRALTGTYPAYIADVLSSYYHTRLVLGGLHIARTDSTILDNIYRKVHSFEIGPFMFRLIEWLEYESFSDYSIYDITHEGMTFPFEITVVDVSAEHCITNIFMQWSRILFPKISWYRLMFPSCNIILCGTNYVQSVRDFTMTV